MWIVLLFDKMPKSVGYTSNRVKTNYPLLNRSQNYFDNWLENQPANWISSHSLPVYECYIQANSLNI